MEKRPETGVSPMEICSVCGRERRVHTRKDGLPICKVCRQKEKRRQNTVSCGRCGRMRRSHYGFCAECLKVVRRQQEKCAICNGEPVYVKHVCRSCYDKQWRANRPEIICASCGRICLDSSHRAQGRPLCVACFVALRVGICVGCGVESRIAKRLFDGSIWCWKCYRRHRSKKRCDICGMDGLLAISNPPICHQCYAREYNRRPEVCARKASDLAQRRLMNADGNFTAEEWLATMRSWDWRCAYCSERLTRKNRSTDHIVPLTRGGSNNADNIVPCCRSCNSRKNNRLLSEWLASEDCGRTLIRIADHRRTD